MAITINQAIDDYLCSEGIQRSAVDTVRAHRRCLGVLLGVCGPRMTVPRLTRIEIDRALSVARSGLTKRGKVKESSLNIYRAAFKKFVRFCHTAGYLPAQNVPTGHLEYAPRLKDNGRKRKPLTKDQGLQAIDVAASWHPRDRAAVAILLLTGMRESELVELRWNDVHWDDEEIVFFRPKQKEWHVAPFSPTLELELRAWHSWYSARHPEMLGEWRVIPARVQGKPKKSAFGLARMSPEWPIVPARPATSIRTTFKALLAAVGVTDLEGKGAHTFRRTFANLFFEATGDIRYVQEALGHKEQRTTEVYMDKNEQRQKNRRAMSAWHLRPTEVPGNVIPFPKAG